MTTGAANRQPAANPRAARRQCTAGIGFWQGAFRDPADPQFGDAAEAVTKRQGMTIELCYGDHEGGQRVETRFLLLPRGEDQWIASASRHHNVDRPDPR